MKQFITFAFGFAFTYYCARFFGTTAGGIAFFIFIISYTFVSSVVNENEKFIPYLTIYFLLFFCLLNGLAYVQYLLEYTADIYIPIKEKFKYLLYVTDASLMFALSCTINKTQKNNSKTFLSSRVFSAKNDIGISLLFFLFVGILSRVFNLPSPLGGFFVLILIIFFRIYLTSRIAIEEHLIDMLEEVPPKIRAEVEDLMDNPT